MKREDFLDAVGQISESYVEEASNYSYNRKISRIRTFSLLAAAVLVLAVTARFFLPGILTQKTGSDNKKGGNEAGLNTIAEAQTDTIEQKDQAAYDKEARDEVSTEDQRSEYYSSAPKAEGTIAETKTAPPNQAEQEPPHDAALTETETSPVIPGISAEADPVIPGISAEAALSPDKTDTYLVLVNFDTEKIASWKLVQGNDPAVASFSAKELFGEENDDKTSVLYELEGVQVKEDHIIAWLEVSVPSKEDLQYLPITAEESVMPSGLSEVLNRYLEKE